MSSDREFGSLTGMPPEDSKGLCRTCADCPMSFMCLTGDVQLIIEKVDTNRGYVVIKGRRIYAGQSLYECPHAILHF